MTISTLIYTMLNCRKVGEDEFGNKYYINKNENKRSVIYKGKAEATKIPPLWHGWLHYTTDQTPTKLEKKFFWQKLPLPNLTGTKLAYFPDGDPRSRQKKRKIVSSDYMPWKP